MKKIKLTSAVVMLLASLSATSITAFAEVEEDYARNYTSGGIVTFEADKGPTDPVDPKDPDPNKPVKPWDPTTPDNNPNLGTDGPLSLDFASSIDFGLNKITNKDVLYYAEPQYLWNEDGTGFDPSTATINYVQVSDKRGTNGGWTLKVKQEDQFKNEDTLNKVLTGSEIIFNNGVARSNGENVIAPKAEQKIVLVPGEETAVMSAEVGAGAGTWVDGFGQLEEIEVDGKTVQKNTAITLSVPGSTPKDAVRYDTKLIWTLTDVPGNTTESEEEL